MKLLRHLFLLSLVAICQGCNEKTADTNATEPAKVSDAEIRAADEASLLATARKAGVSDADALAAKAEFDKVYDETSAKMDQAETERLARMKQLKDESCVAGCD